MITRVVVPLDGSPPAARAIPPARSLAERTGASLLLMTAARDPHVQAAREHLEERAAELGLDRVETAVVRDSSAAEAILTEARDPNTVVCMSTHGRSGIGQVLLGSVAEAVLRGSERPVLVIGPSVDRGCWQFAHWFADGKLVAAIDGSTVSETVIPVVAEWARLLGLRAWVVQVVKRADGIEPNPDESRRRPRCRRARRRRGRASPVGGPGRTPHPGLATGLREPLACVAGRDGHPRTHRIGAGRARQRRHARRPPQPLSGTRDPGP